VESERRFAEELFFARVKGDVRRQWTELTGWGEFCKFRNISNVLGRLKK